MGKLCWYHTDWADIHTKLNTKLNIFKTSDLQHEYLTNKAISLHFHPSQVQVNQKELVDSNLIHCTIYPIQVNDIDIEFMLMFRKAIAK